jgi:phage host-nuclease inhibitor protein Gam
MARKRVVEAPSLHSWEDVNDALRQIAEAQIALGEIQSDMQKQILGAQKVAEEQSKPLNDNVAKLEREIKSFVTDHRDEMGKTKSVVLTFGEVGFRLSTSVSLPRAKEKLEEIIRRLKSRQMTDCIVVEEKVSKEALKKYGEDTVNAVGATWKQSDVFGYEVNIAKLEQIKAATEEGGSRNDSSKGLGANSPPSARCGRSRSRRSCTSRTKTCTRLSTARQARSP